MSEPTLINVKSCNVLFNFFYHSTKSIMPKHHNNTNFSCKRSAQSLKMVMLVRN
jgi:hypothetical protein